MPHKTDADRVYLVKFNISYDGSMEPSVKGTLITPTKPTVSESTHFALVREIEAMVPRSYRSIGYSTDTRAPDQKPRYLGWIEIAGYDRIGQSRSYIHFDKAPWLDK